MNTGVTEGMTFVEQRQIVIVNIIGFLGGTISLIVVFFNLFNGLPVLVILNMITLVTGYSIIYFHKTRFRKIAPVIMGFIYSVCFALGSILCNNNTELFLLLYIGVYFIVLNNIRIILLFSAFNALLFIIISFHVFHVTIFKPVPDLRKKAVIVLGISLFFFFLHYFKSQSRAYQSEIERRNKELDNANKEKEKLFAVIAHDIRSPILSVLNILQMIQDGTLAAQELEQVSGNLYNQVSNVSENIDTILHWSQSQLKGIDVKAQKIELLPLVTRVIALIQFQVDSKSLNINLSGIKHQLVYADPDHLELVIRNLLANAIKFSFKEGSIELYTTLQQNSIELTIQDHGKGISVDNALSLLDELSFISTYGTDNEKGTGLGLKLCKEFIRKNGGDLRFSSMEGKGASFMVTIPKPPGDYYTG